MSPDLTVIGYIDGVRPIRVQKMAAAMYAAYVDIPWPKREESSGRKRVTMSGVTQEDAHNRVVAEVKRLRGES